MNSQGFRRLDVDLPKQPLADQRPWLAAGLLLAAFILLIIVCTYFTYKNKKIVADKPKQSATHLFIERAEVGLQLLQPNAYTLFNKKSPLLREGIESIRRF